MRRRGEALSKTTGRGRLKRCDCPDVNPNFPLCFEAHMHRLPVENEVLADKYRVERVIGRGGMGIVLAAWHLALDQRVALKCLQPELAQNGDSAARFLREARAA